MDHKSVFQTLSQIPPTPVIHLLKEDELMPYWYFQHIRDTSASAKISLRLR